MIFSFNWIYRCQAYNIISFLINVYDDYSFEIDGKSYAYLKFVKELGTAEKRWPKKKISILLVQLKNIKKNGLFKYLLY